MSLDLDDPFKGITECASHTQRMDEGCEFCEAEFEAKNDVSEQITQMVQTGVKELMRDGVQMPNGLITNVRLELLIESMLQDRNRLHFEVEVGRRLYHSVQETKKDLTRQKITGGNKQGLQVVTR